MEGREELEDYNQLMQKISSWSEELLLRGLSQFTLKDIDVLEQLIVETSRFQMNFLREILEHMIEDGRKTALGSGDEELMLLHYCRLTQYVQLSIQESS
ncbi:hypothetical protein DET54_11386 [Paenibacillus pabuli]|uniref:Uncharacterized protein n=2 Tax=Paenibacillus TaxID=44249 RepID=A0A855XT69_9BACL|nr:hypothetical protein DET56_107248 [Paenibacillus pabuli]PXW06031.1 hypothetical protein DEU73_107248 [Paenibacillus taichungensis]RAI89803.1 hypothetical protein DET54_11386 [Paenibacillus pabuli]